VGDDLRVLSFLEPIELRMLNGELRPERSCSLGGGLSARSLGCGNDFVEARVTAQIIPARIEAEVAVCRAGRNRRDRFKLIERFAALACPRVNQCQIGSPDWTVGPNGPMLNPRALECAARNALFMSR
jgi:hypothetical protein